MSIALCRAGAVTGVAAAFLIAGAGVAAAHVTVVAPGATTGSGDAAITFRVPDESDTTSTVGVKLQLPTDHPIAGVMVAPQPGWTASITQTTLSTPIKTDDGDITEVVSGIEWKAITGGGIKPGFFGQFTVIAGQLPEGVTSLTFKAIQTYSDGKQVSWVEQAAAGSSEEPEFPAPTLALAAGAAAGHATVTTTTATTSTAQPAASGASKGAVTAALAVGGVGVVLGAAGLGFGLAAARRRPVTVSPPVGRSKISV